MGIMTAGLKCAIIVRTSGPPETEKWYTIWKNVAAVVKLCVSERSKGGIAFRMGEEPDREETMLCLAC